MFKSFLRMFMKNPFDAELENGVEKGAKTLLLTWNRGLGDIPLGIYALVHRIKEFIPAAEITFLTRQDLALGFELLNTGKVFSVPSWKRGVPFELEKSLREVGLEKAAFDLIIENPDPTQWVKWQLGSLIPRLQWKKEWDQLSAKYDLKGKYLGVHVHSETTYGYQKNWDQEKWRDFFKSWQAQSDIPILLFGFSKTPLYLFENMLDLRGETSLFEMLSIIKNYCSHLVVPDSGVLSITYYLDLSFPINIVSLWADPRQGVLKQNVPSPNSLLEHHPLIGEDKNINTIRVEQLLEALYGSKQEV